MGSHLGLAVPFRVEWRTGPVHHVVLAPAEAAAPDLCTLFQFYCPVHVARDTVVCKAEPSYISSMREVVATDGPYIDPSHSICSASRFRAREICREPSAALPFSLHVMPEAAQTQIWLSYRHIDSSLGIWSVDNPTRPS